MARDEPGQIERDVGGMAPSPLEQRTRPLFMISVAAELAEMHPQTLRMYERRGLICPSRSAKKTRLYSLADVERLRHIQRLTSELGLNLAGVERVLALEKDLEKAHWRVRELEEELIAALDRAREEMEQLKTEMEQVHRSYRRELVPVTRGEIVVRSRTGRRR